jgi:hypothetical protein
MSDKEQIIKNAYIAYGFPGESRLFTLLSKDHKEITKEDIKNFLGHQEAEQIYKPHQTPRRSKQGSITAYTINELWQMDIFSLFNFVDSFRKSVHKYAFCCIDVFTRKAYVIPMKDKSTESVSEAFETILNDNKDNYPKIIMSDQDSVFTSAAFEKILDKYQISLNLYIKGDHNALGIIDAYAKRLKLQLAKYVLINNHKIKWDQLLNEVVSNYNNTPNKSINDIKPNEAHLEKNIETIFGINVFKKKGISAESDLVRGDQVRIRILKTMNTKSSSPQFSNEVYTVVYPNGNNIKLSDGKTYKRYSILKVVSDAQPVINPKQKLIKNARYTHKEAQRLDKQEANISTYEPRTIRSNFGKPPDKLNI